MFEIVSTVKPSDVMALFVIFFKATEHQNPMRLRLPIYILDTRMLSSVHSVDVICCIIMYILRRFNHHHDFFEGGVRVDRVPLDAVSDEIVVVRPLVVINAIKVGLETTLEPPGAVVVVGAVVIETIVIVTVFCAKHHRVVAVPRRCHGVSCVATVAMHV